MTTLLIEGRKVKVSDDFLSMSPEQQEATVEEIARSLNVQPKQGGFMPNLNQGIAEGIGGLVDLINPFDQPHSLNPFPQGTGSAQTGLERGMDAIGVTRADGEPTTALESFARGSGQAASLAPVGGAVMQGFRGAGGLLGAIADDASTAMNTTRGFLSEAAAGGGGQMAQDAAEAQGLPDWAQTTAGLIGGAGVGALPYIASKTPSAIGARAIQRQVKTAMLPYTKAGGQEVARQRVQELAGGPERAAELAKNIQPTEIGLTPAQQTGDPNLLGLEQEAARRNPLLRDRLERQAQTAEDTATSTVRGMGGDVTQAQSFFEARRQDARKNILGIVDRATNGALRPTAKNSEMLNSSEVASKIEEAARATKEQERALWNAVDRSVPVSTQAARATANQLIQETPRAQQDDIVRVVRELLGSDSNDPFGEIETVNEMHGLYSKLREISRAAKAGPAPQNNKARISDAIADAILEDLGATADAAPSAVGRQINAARAYTAEREQIFNQGTVGRLRRRTTSGDDAIAPELSLERSVGRGGPTGAVGAEDILSATDGAAEPNIEDYLRSRFDRTAFNPDGTFNQRQAQVFMRDNADLMQKFPYLRDTFDEALRTQGLAASRSARADRALTDMDNPSKSIGAAFTQAAPENAIDAVFKAKRPSVAARQLAATARKDKDGAALDGLKGAFSDYVIRRSTDANGLSGEAMQKLLSSQETRSALLGVLEPTEIRRMDTIAAELKKLRTGRKAAPDIGGLSPRSPNRLIEIVARVIAARQGAQAGGGSSGASIQTANMASNRMKALLGNLQNDKAEQMLMDAVTDPELFRLLLTDPGAVELKPKQINKLAPYFTGAAAATATDEQPPLRMELTDPGNQRGVQR